MFEHVYFARPDSLVFGRTVLESRLAARPPARARGARPTPTSWCPVPDSGMGAALGFSQESGLPFEWGLIRNHYVGRTFIEPRQGQRSAGVKIKLNPVRQVIEGRRVVLIDDSIVRGTTSRKIVRMVREAGAREVHLRISSPPTTGPCYYGIDTPLKSELIAVVARGRGDPPLRRGRQPRPTSRTRGCSRRRTTRRAAVTAPPASRGRYPVAVTLPDESQLRLFEKARA